MTKPRNETRLDRFDICLNYKQTENVENIKIYSLYTVGVRSISPCSLTFVKKLMTF